MALLVVARSWIPPMRSSLWLDELGTVWLTRGSLGDTLARTADYQGGAPLYYLLLWPLRRVLGVNEVALRSLSLLAMLVAAVLLVLLGRRLFGMTTGVVAGLLFLALPMTGFAAADARPYALATAALVGNALALLSWQTTGRARYGFLHAATLAATVYLHYLYVPALVAQSLYALRLPATVPWTRRLLLPYGSAALLLLPGTPILLRVVGDRGLLSNPYPQSPVQVLEQLLPPVLAATVLAGATVLALLPRARADEPHLPGGAGFALAWFTVPFLTVVAVTQLTASDVLIPRYLSSVLPAVALLLALLTTRFGDRWAQLAVGIVVCGVALTRVSTTTHTEEDWRAAAAAERALVTSAATPVLLFSGFIEGNRPDWLEDPERASYLNAPAAAYPLEGEVRALPFSINAETEPYLQGLVADLAGHERFVLLTRGTDPFNAYLLSRLEPVGYRSSLVANVSGQILLYSFER
jgi:mannosyltransferase